MKKKWAKLLIQSLGVLAMLLMGFGIGFTAMSVADQAAPGQGLMMIAGALVMLFVWMQLHVVAHEAGHLVCGLMTGYGFVSFRVGSHIWQRGADGRLHHGRMTLAGTGGQCLLSPPPMKDGRYPYGWYHAGGALANLLLAVLLGLAAWLCPAHALPRLILLEGAVIGAVLGLVNILPWPGAAVSNDGSNLLAIRRHPEARQAMWLQIKINQLLASGLRLGEMPEELFPDFPEAALDQPLVLGCAIMKANRTMERDLPAALGDIRRLLAREQTMPPLYRAMLLCDGATLELLLDEPPVLAAQLAEKDMAKLLKAMKATPAVLRTRYVIALLREHDREGARKLQAAFDKAAGAWPNPQEIDGERALMRSAQVKAEAA